MNLFERVAMPAPRGRVLSIRLSVFLLAALGVARAQDQPAPETGVPPAVVAPVATGASAQGQIWSWSQLQTWNAEQGPAVRLSRLKEHVASSNLRLLESDTGARLIGTAGVSKAKEPVTDVLNRSYTRTFAQGGLRWSFLGAEEARRRSVLEARADQLGTAAQTQVLQAQALTELGHLYVRYLRSQQREQLTQKYLASAGQEQHTLNQRMASGNLLRAEGLELWGYYEAAQARSARERELQAAALRQMGFLSGHVLRAQSVPALAMPARCLSQSLLQEAVLNHPALEASRHAMQGAKEQAQHTRFGGVEGGVQLSQSFSKDINGSAGHATAVAVDVSIPLQWKVHKEALAAKLQGQYNAAAEAQVQTEQRLQLEQQTAVEQYQLREREVRDSEARYAAAAEGWRVARLRVPSMDGGGIVDGVKARHLLYENALLWVNSAESQDLAAVDLLYYSGNCALQQRDSDPLQQLVAGAFVETGAKGSGTESPQPLTAADDSGNAPPGTGWYAWKGSLWLQRPAKLDQLPAGSQRLLLSFTEAQLKQLAADPQVRLQLDQLANKAKQRGIKLELLLGEPSWVLPQGRGNLLVLLKQVRGLPFEMVHLDLERSQLPAAQQTNWEQNTLDTLTEAVAQTRVPISLTTHHRELQRPEFLQSLQHAGVKEVVPMVYSASAQRTLDVVRQLPPMPQGVDLAVAQSIEKDLPAEESRFRSGKRQSLAHWRSVAQSLRQVPGFKGIIVQSWEDYMEAQQ